jgi:hypothetical protein
MRGCRVATLTVLVVWVLLGPIGMALPGCMMMDGCDALCSVLSIAPIVAIDLSTQNASVPTLSGFAFYPQNIWSVPESPPKSAPTLL